MDWPAGAVVGDGGWRPGGGTSLVRPEAAAGRSCTEARHLLLLTSDDAGPAGLSGLPLPHPPAHRGRQAADLPRGHLPHRGERGLAGRAGGFCVVSRPVVTGWRRPASRPPCWPWRTSTATPGCWPTINSTSQQRMTRSAQTLLWSAYSYYVFTRQIIVSPCLVEHM